MAPKFAWAMLSPSGLQNEENVDDFSETQNMPYAGVCHNILFAPGCYVHSRNLIYP